MEQLPKRISKYELEHFLGGGMSHVYRARDLVLGRTVAVKILTEAGCVDPEVKARFLQEARIASNLQHENILSIFDFGEENNQPYIVMEFLQGEDLRTAINRNTTGDLQNKLRIARQVARALEYVHDRKLVHRDVKPANINLAPDGTAKLIDFGITKTAGLSVTHAGFVLGTPVYMAPEQMLGREVSHLTDVYAFGLLLFELITGVKPYQSDTVDRLFYRILKEPLETERMRSAGAPEALCTLVERCVEKDPPRRIQSFSVIVADLSALLDQRTGGTRSGNTVVEGATKPRASISAIASPSWILATLGAALSFVGLRRKSTQESRVLEDCQDMAERASDASLDLSHGAAVPGQVPGHSTPPASRAYFSLNESRQFQAAAWGPLPNTERIEHQAVQRTLPVPLLPPNRPSTSSIFEGEFTQTFQTTPDVDPQHRVPAPGGAPPLIESPPNLGAEVTQIWQMERGPQEPEQPEQPGEPASDAAIIPDVALTVTACADEGIVGRRFQIHRFPFRIGSAPSSDLVLSFDRAISRSHVELQFVNGGFAILDVGSSNGSFLNGKRLQRRPEPLPFGASILLGSNTQLTFIANDLKELPDLTGELIGGRYTLTVRLYTSAKSATYRATDIRFQDRPALVKILAPRLAQQTGYREQFEQEARIASRLRHPQIIRILDYGETALGNTSRTLYLSLEFLDGGSLAECLATETRFELDRIAGWLDKLASGLDYAHEEGVIHGGIKPKSIIFDSRDSPYLTDFAIAVGVSDQSHRTVIGSPAFLSPEQWEGNDLSPATDQYSLAVLLYLVITGSHPYEGQEHPEMRKRNLLRGPVAAHEMAQSNDYPFVPAAVSAVLQKAMATDPSARFLTSTEFARAFRTALLAQVSAIPKKPYVFISYHRATGSPWALLLKNELEREHGFEVFIDTEQKDRAGQFPVKLERHIERSDVFVCLLGKGTLESAWVNREIEVANQRHKPMVPVFQEGFRFPGDMNTVAPHVRELLLFDGVKLLDRQNLYVPSAIKNLGEAIRHSLPNT